MFALKTDLLIPNTVYSSGVNSNEPSGLITALDRVYLDCRTNGINSHSGSLDFWLYIGTVNDTVYS